MTTYSIALVSIYKDHITYYHLPSEPVLNHGTLSSLQQLEPKKLVLIGSSHTYRLSALVPASLETEYLKLPSQSRTNVEQRIEQLAVSIASFELSPGDFVYIDALSNQIFMGSDEDGLSIEPKKDGSNAWHNGIVGHS